MSNAKTKKSRQTGEDLELGINKQGHNERQVVLQNKPRHEPRRAGNNAGVKNGKNDGFRVIVLISNFVMILPTIMPT